MRALPSGIDRQTARKYRQIQPSPRTTPKAAHVANARRSAGQDFLAPGCADAGGRSGVGRPGIVRVLPGSAGKRIGRGNTPTRPGGVGPGADPAARIHGLAALRWTDKLVQQAAGGPAGTAFGSPAQSQLDRCHRVGRPWRPIDRQVHHAVLLELGNDRVRAGQAKGKPPPKEPA